MGRKAYGGGRDLPGHGVSTWTRISTTLGFGEAELSIDEDDDNDVDNLMGYTHALHTIQASSQ